MKKILIFSFAIISTLLLFACTNDIKVFEKETGGQTEITLKPDIKVETTEETKKRLSGSLKVVTTNEAYKELFDKFEKETGVNSDIIPMSSGDVLAKLREDGSVPLADLWFGGGIDTFMEAKDDGLLERVDFEDSKLLDPQFKDYENYYFSKGITVVGFLFNDDLMKEKKLEYPKTWEDLLDPKYKRMIAMANPSTSGTNYAVVNALIQNKRDGWGFIEKFVENVGYFGRRAADPIDEVVLGDFPIGITYIDGTLDEMVEKNNLSIQYPEDGLPWVTEGVAVFKNCENLENAKYFIEWLYSNDENLILLANIDQKTSIKVIKPSIEGLTLYFNPKKLMEEDLTLFGSMREEIIPAFEKLIGMPDFSNAKNVDEFITTLIDSSPKS